MNAPQATPQAFISSYAPRLRQYGNSLLQPVIPQTTLPAPLSRTTKRGTTVISYAEDQFDDDDFEDGEGPRRPTGLRSRREDPVHSRETLAEKLGKELSAPIDVQGIWRDWMGKPRLHKTEKQLHAQSALPFNLIPIRIDLNIPAFTPAPALPMPGEALAHGVNPTLPAYRTPETTTPYKLSDVFLWNLHETIITADIFAMGLVHDLDLPNPVGTAMEIALQIRRQLEEHASIALHPLFQTTPPNSNNPPQTNGVIAKPPPSTQVSNLLPLMSGTPSTPQPNDHATTLQPPISDKVTAVASRPSPPSGPSPVLNPDDTYRCIISLNIYLQNRLLTDRFEWSLLHPPGFAELFARQTVADIGLPMEWIPVMAHAIYESVLKLKKEACESGGVLVGAVDGGNGLDNLSAGEGVEGWRYDEEGLCGAWEPRVERLSKEEIEKREGDRERQIRRMRRETARFSSTTTNFQSQPLQPSTPGYFDQPAEGEAMGRGERSKKKRRFRSLSPVGRVGTPGGRGTPDAGGYGGAGGTSQLNEAERQIWRCSHCMVHGTSVWGIKDGPVGPRTLCTQCGLAYERDKRLPPWAKNLHISDQPIGGR